MGWLDALPVWTHLPSSFSLPSAGGSSMAMSTSTAVEVDVAQ
jgi:hypothetical protein